MSESFEISLPIPFYSQRIEDGMFDREGFRSREEAAYWQDRGCGVACLKMILDGYRIASNLAIETSYGQLVCQGLEMGAYCKKGWIHAGLVRLANRYGLQGSAFRNSDISTLLAELKLQRPCIVSVTTCFRGGLNSPDGIIFQPGGHLAVALGFNQADGETTGFIVNHPSSSSEYNWSHRSVDLSRFKASFSGSFMSFWV